MIYTKNTLSENIISKIKNMTFNAIVTEAFISALPLDDISLEEKKKLSNYSFNVLESLGSYKILEDALKTQKNIHSKAFLTEISSICTEAAKKTAKRIMKDYGETDEKDKPSKIIDKSKMTPNELGDFYNKMKSSDIQEISAEINKKVIEVIKDEKQSYKAENELKEKLDEQLAENDKTIESVLPFITNKNDALTHTSLFSTIQTSCIESLVYKNNNYKSFHTDLIKDITLNFYGKKNNSKTINDMDEALESLSNYVKEPQLNDFCNKKKLFDIALINTITVYTMLETLNTLNLINPTFDNIKNYILTRKNIENINTEKCDNVSSYAESCIKNVNRNICNSRSIVALERCKEQLSSIKESLLKGEDNINRNLIEMVDSSSEMANEKINKLKSKSIEGIVEESDRAFLSDVAELNKICNLIGRKPGVVNVMLVPTTESSIDAYGLDYEGKTIAKSFMDISKKYSLLNKTLESYLGDVTKKSKFNDSKLNLFFKENGQKHNLK